MRKTLSGRAIILSDAHKVGNKRLCRLLENNMDLVSPFPSEFLTPGGMEPRHTTKSETVLSFQSAIYEIYFHSEEHYINYVFKRYPITKPRTCLWQEMV